MHIPITNKRRVNTPCRHSCINTAAQNLDIDTRKHRFILGFIVLVFMLVTLTSTVHADPAPIQQPYELVSNTTEKMLSALRKDRELILQNPTHVYVLADEIVLPHVDFQYMSTLVLGKHWRSATDEQKQRFPQEFRSLILRTYATALNEYTNERVVYLPFRDNVALGDVRVNTEIRRDTGPPIPLGYSLHLKEGTWKVYDIRIDGVSLVTNYRSSFSNEIQRNGLDRLIGKLTERNAGVTSVQ